jgi:hypothetical protein
VKRNPGPSFPAKVRSMPEAREFCFGHSQLLDYGFPILAQD